MKNELQQELEFSQLSFLFLCNETFQVFLLSKVHFLKFFLYDLRISAAETMKLNVRIQHFSR